MALVLRVDQSSLKVFTKEKEYLTLGFENVSKILDFEHKEDLNLL